MIATLPNRSAICAFLSQGRSRCPPLPCKQRACAMCVLSAVCCQSVITKKNAARLRAITGVLLVLQFELQQNIAYLILRSAHRRENAKEQVPANEDHSNDSQNNSRARQHYLERAVPNKSA